MKKLWMILPLSLAMIPMATGCGDDGGDTGDDDDDDYVFPDLPVAQNGECQNAQGQPCTGADDAATTGINPATATPADFSCLGNARTVGDTPTAMSMEIADGTSRDIKNGSAPVMLLLDNMFDDPFETDATTNEQGIITFEALPGQLFGYRVQPQGLYVDSVQYNLIADETVDIEASSGSVGAIQGFAAIVGVTLAAGNGLISGALEDCNGEDVYGVVARFFRASDGLEYREDSAFKVEYFNGVGAGSPRAGRDFTQVDGRYGAINIPGGQENLVGIYGRTEAGGGIRLLSCERHYTLAAEDATADGLRLTVTTSRPLRPETASLGCPPGPGDV